MAKIKVTGGSIYEIDEEKAKKLILWKYGDEKAGIVPMPKDKMVVINDSAYLEMKDIRMIELSSNDAKAYSNDKRWAEHAETEKKVKQRYKEIAGWDSVRKSERMLKTFVLLLFRSRGNKGDITEPLYSKLMESMFEWFEKNKEEIHCPKEVYRDLIPIGKIMKGAGGFKSFGELAGA
jgi:hypothetical protein